MEKCKKKTTKKNPKIRKYGEKRKTGKRWGKKHMGKKWEKKPRGRISASMAWNSNTAFSR